MSNYPSVPQNIPTNPFLPLPTAVMNVIRARLESQAVYRVTNPTRHAPAGLLGGDTTVMWLVDNLSNVTPSGANYPFAPASTATGTGEAALIPPLVAMGFFSQGNPFLVRLNLSFFSNIRSVLTSSLFGIQYGGDNDYLRTRQLANRNCGPASPFIPFGWGSSAPGPAVEPDDASSDAAQLLPIWFGLSLEDSSAVLNTANQWNVGVPCLCSLNPTVRMSNPGGGPV